MNGNPMFYRYVFITLVSFLLVNVLTHPTRDRHFRTVFMVTETLWFFFLTMSNPNISDGMKRRERRASVFITVLFLYFFHTHEYVHRDRVE